jgi:hypothetical protein
MAERSMAMVLKTFRVGYPELVVFSPPRSSQHAENLATFCAMFRIARPS